MNREPAIVSEAEDGYSIEARAAEDEAGTDIPDRIEFGIFDREGELCLSVTVSIESARELLSDLAKLLAEGRAS